jgi:hypothetical protein
MVAGAPWQDVVASSEVRAFLASPRTGVYVVDAAGNLPEVARFRAALSQGDGVIWMRLVMPDGGRSWFQVDTRVRQGLILCAFRRAPDAGQRVRFDIHPRRP